MVEKKAETKKADKKAGKRKGPLPLFLGEVRRFYLFLLHASVYICTSKSPQTSHLHPRPRMVLFPLAVQTQTIAS